MHASLRLLNYRRFLPLFVTQFLGAFNDNLFKNAIGLLVVFQIYNDPRQEQNFTAIASAVYILPFFLFSALGGQLADSMDKARIIRIVKTLEIGIMAIGALGLLIQNIPILLLVLFLIGTHSSFFGPTKYAILPQHLAKDEVLGGTSMVEAGTYVAILIGTIVGGVLPSKYTALLGLAVAGVGMIAAWRVPPAPPEKGAPVLAMDYHILRASWSLISRTMHIPRLYLTITAISFFVAEVIILGSIFPPMVKNVLGADERVATLMLVVLTVGVSIGAVLINTILKGKVSAQYAPHSALGMAFFLMTMYLTLAYWPVRVEADLVEWRDFLQLPLAYVLMAELLCVAIAGGMFVVPLYAFLTTTVEKSEAARTVAANNIVTSGAGVVAVVLFVGIQRVLTIPQSFLVVAAVCIASTWYVQKLHEACD